MTGEIRHVIKAQQFRDPSFLEELFREADSMESRCASGSCPQLLRGKLMVTLFYEPSTRTRLSFESAMQRLGGSVIGTEDASQFSSTIKGESLPDTIRTVGQYADIIVLRHPMEGSSAASSEISPVPLINAGDGAGQHPTQALLDMYTIRKELGTTEGLTVAMAGDLLYGRTVHSLAYLMARQKGTRFIFASPERLSLPFEINDYLTRKGATLMETRDLREAVREADVLYMTRVQKERFASDEEYMSLRGSYVLDRETLGLMKKDSVIMHPLPRVDEIAPEVDDDPRAAYFRQARNGLYIRMALLKMLLAGSNG